MKKLFCLISLALTFLLTACTSSSYIEKNHQLNIQKLQTAAAYKKVDGFKRKEIQKEIGTHTKQKTA